MDVLVMITVNSYCVVCVYIYIKYQEYSKYYTWINSSNLHKPKGNIIIISI